MPNDYERSYVNLVNADRSSRKTHGVSNFVNDMKDVSLFKTCRMGGGQSPTPTVWLSHDDPRYVDEWARVQEMRRKDPNGLVAGGRATNPGDFIDYNVHDHAIFKQGLRGVGQGKKNMAARHYSSN